MNRFLYDIGSFQESGRKWGWFSNLIVLFLPKLLPYKCDLQLKEGRVHDCNIQLQDGLCSTKLLPYKYVQSYKDTRMPPNVVAWGVAQNLDSSSMVHSMLIKLDSRVSGDDSIDKSIELKIGSLVTKSDLNLIWKHCDGFLQLVVVIWEGIGTKIKVFIILRLDLADFFNA